jgi:hypothetical protein
MTELTQYGFKFGPMEVTRMCADDRYHTICVKTKYGELVISVSPTGRAFHVGRTGSARTSQCEA